MSKEELEELAKRFIIDHKSLSDYEKELYKHIEYIEREIAIIDRRRKRLLRVWKAISVKLMKEFNKKVGL